MKQVLAKETPVTRGLSRRKALNLIGAIAAAPFLWWARGRPASGEPTGTSNQTPTRTTTATTPSCVVRPQQTEGPFFVDERLNRSDIRSDPSDGSVKKGLPLRLVIHVYRIDGGSCTPLLGAYVDIWQCDALGAYSDVLGFFEDTRGKKFLRGYQVTDAVGKAEFMTIYPGWYPGRTVHIHFKIRTYPKIESGHEFTSQLYFDDSITGQVHTQSPYAARGRRTTTNAADGIFRHGGCQLVLNLVKDAQGYAGTLDIGLRMT
ncbi:MAG: intradiol ring-cleavage dioxygenase [Thermodesulfobacteriota bacterium]